jgi:hypothetical protein
MAKLLLKFENKILEDVRLTQTGVTIGRLPDNDIRIDNPAVSSHHARVYWDGSHFVVEDAKSLNGTYVNDRPVNQQVLGDNDIILVGKHTLTFKAEPGERVAASGNEGPRLLVPTLDSTAMLETQKAKELLAHAMAKGQPAAAAPAPAVTGAFELPVAAPAAPSMRRGVLSIVSGKTDQRSYVLTGKLTVIGKSEMASIRLKGWFAPQVAAAISRRDDRYFIAPGGRQKVKVNGQATGGQWELQPGDMITVAKVTMTFNYNE